MEITRRRPIKTFRVKEAHGGYRKGDIVQPTGIYRDMLLKRGWIEEITEPVQIVDKAALLREAQPANDRMVRLPEGSEARPILHTRKRTG